MSSPIYFNAKSSNYYQLSNFYGDVEFEYMKARFRNKKVKDLLDTMKSCEVPIFQAYLKMLQPEKKWTDAKLRYWIRDNKPIYGILAKLIGNVVKNRKSNQK